MPNMSIPHGFLPTHLITSLILSFNNRALVYLKFLLLSLLMHQELTESEIWSKSMQSCIVSLLKHTGKGVFSECTRGLLVMGGLLISLGLATKT